MPQFNPERMDASIEFLDGEFSLIHISLELYPTFLQPILRVLLPNEEEPEDGDSDNGADFSKVSINEKVPFVNISITPIECSVVCTTELAERFFVPAIESLPAAVKDQVSVLKDPYMIFSVNSGSMGPGQRVIQLTAPLAMAGISIFFITTYYTDFILVPAKDRSIVISVLLDRGFRFEDSVMNDIDFTIGALSQANLNKRGRSMSGNGDPIRPNFVPSSVSDLMRRTLQHLKANNIVPYIMAPTDQKPDPMRVICVKGWSHRDAGDFPGAYMDSSRNKTHHNNDWLKHIDKRLYLAVINVLTRNPRFFSLTLTLEDSMSILMDKELLWLFGDAVQGNMEEILVPIFLDLRNLPIDVTGIVCGVGGMVSSEARRTYLNCNEMSYLSTAKAGCVLIHEGGAEGALEAMKGSGAAFFNDVDEDEDDKRREEQQESSGVDSSPPVRHPGAWDIPAPKARRT